VWSYALLSAIAGGIWTIQPSLMSKLLNTIQASGGITEANQGTVVLLIVSLLGVELVAWLFHATSRVLENKSAFHAYSSYKKHLLAGVFALPVSWHAEQDTGKVLDKINKASDSLYSFGRSTFQIIHFVVRILVTSTILFIFDPFIALITIIFILASFVLTYTFDVKLNAILAILHKHENEVTTRIVDAVTNVLSVKILHIEKPIMRGVTKAMSLEKEPSYRWYLLTEWKWFSGGMIFSFINLIPLLSYVWYVQAHDLPFQVGTFMALYLYSSNLINVYYTFNSEYEQIMRHRTRILNAKDIEDAIEANVQSERRQIGGWHSLALFNVLFRYGGSETPQVDNVSLTIKRGEKIALLGSSGSGKTTFLKIIHGLYDTARGDIRIDNGPIAQTTFRDIDLLSIMVPQEPEVFSSTIRENITLGQDYSEDEIQEAMETARFSDVLDLLPNGLESVVNEKGVNLSGGQKQRLALARALLFSREKELLLLDESTSSVDPMNEAKIYEAILHLWKDYTVIATIHKLNLLKYFDRIIIFDAGHIVDDGSFNELYTRNSVFKAQWDDFIANQSVSS
jgi:ABC-type multidrug transport system fused ATPase/permease subunit